MACISTFQGRHVGLLQAQAQRILLPLADTPMLVWMRCYRATLLLVVSSDVASGYDKWKPLRRCIYMLQQRMFV